VAALQQAAAQIAQNDCTPLAQAAAKLEKTAVELITPIVEKIQPIVQIIRDALDFIWAKIGAPIWNWIQEYAAQQWKLITDLADLAASAVKWLWEGTKKSWSFTASLFSKAWTWLKDKLGLGEGESGQNGLMEWVKTKLQSVWETV